MKKHLKYFWSLTLLAAIGCSDFGNTNVSPNGSTVPLTSALLTQAITGGSNGGFWGVGAIAGVNGANVTAGFYCQYFSQTLYTDACRYSLQDVNWTEMNRSMFDLQNIININSDPATATFAALNGSNNNQIAIARILKAINFSILTDRYGDMPYSEALKGTSNPKYDKQEDIYPDLLKELREAVGQFDNLPPTVKGDVLFNGNTTRWKQFANSWRLILALRISKANPTLGKTEFNDALNADGGLLETSADDIVLAYPGTAAEFNNPWYTYGGDQNVAATIADFLNTTGDDRRFAYGNASGTTLVGMPYGLKRDDAILWTSANPAHSLILNDKYRATTSTLTILTAGDVLLARAEAAVPLADGGLAWTNEDYAALYAKGIAESWNHWEQDGAGPNYDNYMARPEVDLAQAGSVLEKIGIQRWISFYPNGPQGWSEWRRTGYPQLVAPADNLNPSQKIPRRFVYPTSEYGLNPGAVKAAVSLLEGGDSRDSRVWWDK
jgi:hypothetical protein